MPRMRKVLPLRPTFGKPLPLHWEEDMWDYVYSITPQNTETVTVDHLEDGCRFAVNSAEIASELESVSALQLNPLVYAKITADTDANNYTADIYLDADASILIAEASDLYIPDITTTLADDTIVPCFRPWVSAGTGNVINECTVTSLQSPSHGFTGGIFVITIASAKEWAPISGVSDDWIYLSTALSAIPSSGTAYTVYTLDSTYTGLYSSSGTSTLYAKITALGADSNNYTASIYTESDLSDTPVTGKSVYVVGITDSLAVDDVIPVQTAAMAGKDYECIQQLGVLG